jgi:transcription-repair coupling factor (superfamily II helicase)
MDRVVCGDVGFGKTEVAVRAAFAAASAGKQVAVLVPTTLLAEQHYRNFRDRFADWPLKVEVLSRFKTTKEIKAELEKVAAGTIDVIVGTHRLLQPDVKFKDLGLVIVDEEQRFGVRQKEALKALRANVHLLTLTATPIPRTLNMAWPACATCRSSPRRRRTGWRCRPSSPSGTTRCCAKPSSASCARRPAVLPAQRRGKHRPHAASCPSWCRKRASASPTGRCPSASWKGDAGLPEAALQRAAVDHDHRIGHRHPQRQHHHHQPRRPLRPGPAAPAARPRRPFAPPRLRLPGGARPPLDHPDAEKRLEAIASMDELGAGFTLATHDLEIRGAGELLGEDQSGQMAEVGFSLYTELLDARCAASSRASCPTWMPARKCAAPRSSCMCRR